MTRFSETLRKRRHLLRVESLEDRCVPVVWIAEPNDTLGSGSFDTRITGQQQGTVVFEGAGLLGDKVTSSPSIGSDEDYLKLNLRGGDRIGVGVAYMDQAIVGALLFDSSGQNVPVEQALGDDPQIPFPSEIGGSRTFFHYTVKTI